MYEPFPKLELREALLGALPENDSTQATLQRGPAFTYVPPSHARALDPESVIVEGIRGAGKSHWWAALNSAAHRHYLAAVVSKARISDKVDVSQGFGAGVDPGQWPGKDVLADLAGSGNPRHIWQAVLAAHACFSAPFPQEPVWKDRVYWVHENPEKYEQLLYKVDHDLFQAGRLRLVLFDALDRLADDWSSIRPLARSLFQLALDLRSTRSLRFKLFVRPDMLEDREILAFPDSSKLPKVSLNWRRIDLYALLFQCLSNAEKQGHVFREHSEKVFDLIWQRDSSSQVWILPARLQNDENIQKEVFHAIAGPTMANNPSTPSARKRGFPYTWLPSHLLDGREQVSPRSFVAALRHAARHAGMPDDWPYPLHSRDIQAGVQEASRIRVNEITREDYPWVDQLMAPLRGKLTVPCAADEIDSLWQSAQAIERLRDHLAQEKANVKLPPPHLGEGSEGVLHDLQELGLVQRMYDGRIQMPDVYRVAFGLGRRGGVKPLK